MAFAVEIFVDAAAKGGAVLVLAMLATFAMRKASAARRHLVWTVGVTALLIIPLLTFVMPAWGVLPTFAERVVAPAATATTAVSTVMLPATALPVGADVDVASAPATTEPGPITGPRARFSAVPPWLIVWLAITSAILFSILLGQLRITWLARRAARMRAGRAFEAAQALGRQQGIRVRLLESDAHAMPMTWGILRPTLLLPSSAHDWPAARLRAVLQHELAHVRRHDARWQLIAQIACAWYWFNPLAWYAAHRMRIEREHACDDAVLQAGSRASEYAAELLDIARSMRAARATSHAAIAMARPRQLEGRLLAVLDERRARGEVPRRWPIWLFAAFVVGPLTALEPAVKEATAVPLITGTTLQSPDCAKEALRQISTTRNDDDYTRIKWESRSCKGTIEIRGTARVAGDLSGFQSISRGGRVVIETDDQGARRKLTLTPSNGRFAYAYEIGGDRKTWDDDGQRWLASVVSILVRRAGFGAEERVDHLLREKGVNGVLEEVAAMESDHTQRVYLNALLDKTTLNGAAVRSVVDIAARALESDHELAQLLMAVNKRYPLTAESRAAYIRATNSLQSDYERRRVLTAVLDTRGAMNADDAIAVLSSAGEMRSDFERAQILKRVSAEWDFGEPRLQQAYLKAAGDMQSDYERRQVLTALLKRGRLAPVALDVVLTAAAAFHSDHERAEVLRLVLQTQTLAPPQRQQMIKLIDAMNSEYERGKVAALMVRQMNN